MYWVYALYSKKIDRLYIGQTQDMNKRLREHREGVSFYTRRAKDWELLHSEEYTTRSEAMKREKQLKSYQGRNYIRKTYLGGS